MSRQGEGNISIDPVCGKPVVEHGADSFDYKRKTYYFCSPRCRADFERRAERIRLAELAKIGGLFSKAKARWGIA